MIELIIVHQQSERTVLTIQLSCHFLHVGKCLVDFSHRIGYINGGKISCQARGVVERGSRFSQRIVGFVHHTRHPSVDLSHQRIEIA